MQHWKYSREQELRTQGEDFFPNADTGPKWSAEWGRSVGMAQKRVLTIRTTTGEIRQKYASINQENGNRM